MTIIACIDDQGGMMFGGRRQSRDRAVTERIRHTIGDKRLYTSTYSAALFTHDSATIADDGYASLCRAEDACFVENGAIPIDRAECIILYRWNRRYPADRFFPIDPVEHGYRLLSSAEFTGSSHDTVTEEIYEKG